MSSLTATDKLINQLSAIYPRGFDLSLDRIKVLLDKLGNPHKNLPPIFHIAGTNGKGSTSSFCRAILEAHGLKVHTHTSPHLVNWTERFRLAGENGSSLVEDGLLATTLQKIVDINDGAKITIFELMMAAGFVLFSEYPADAVILEVGLGGRFDATNIVEQVESSIITSISFDHQEMLGDTIELIAKEKAGIIKPGCPVVLAHQPYDEAIEAIRSEADKLQAPIKIYGEDYLCFDENNRFIFQDNSGLLDLPMPALRGQHQLANASAAIAGLKQSRFILQEDKIAEAMQNVIWPGRLQYLNQGKLVSSMPNNYEIWLDGGHNPAASSALQIFLQQLNKKDPKPTILLWGMLSSKDAFTYIDNLKSQICEVITLPIVSYRASLSPEELVDLAVQSGLKASASPSIDMALEMIKQKYSTDTSVRILISGSLYLVGEVLNNNQTIPV